MSEVWTNPWSFPVPVTRSNFTALFPKHRAYNVEIDAAVVEPFGSRSKNGRPPESLLYADLQTNPDITAHGHLGSGRSGFYRGKYLKGVGRTPLLMSWNSVTDPEHTSGRMTVASAANEWAISCYLSSKGCRDSIVPCEGVLLTSTGGETHAISVKPMGFARMSNFVWMLNHFSEQCSIPKFLALLVEYSGSRSRERRGGAETHPRDAIVALDQAFRRGMANFEIYFRHGVIWHAVRNNFTLDGRFLDLETATCLGAPFIGTLEMNAGPPRGHQVVGLELLSYVAQFRRFVFFLRSRIFFLAEQADILRPREQLIAREVLFQLDRVFGRDHLLSSPEGIQKLAFSMISSNLDVSNRYRSELQDFIRHKYLHPRLRIPGRSTAELVDFRFPIRSLPEKTRARLRSLRCLKLRPGAFQEGENLTENLIPQLTSPRDLDAILSGFLEVRTELGS